MVGTIHKILFDLVESVGGEEAVAEVKRRANVPLDREFRLNEAYDDDEWQCLLSATCEVANITPEQANEAYAEAFYQDALRRWSAWFDLSRDSKQFLERQPTIHNSLAAGVADKAAREAIRDKFRIVSGENELTTHYRSPNKHCGLYKALARKIISHYNDAATIQEHACMLNGADECVIHIRWSQRASSAA